MKKLTKVIDGSSIGLFRIGFGLFMIWELFYFIRIQFVKVFLENPQVQLSYDFLPFLKILPESLLDILIVALLICSLCIVIGRYYKIAIIVFFVGFSYLFLLDKAYYNNHLYLVCLLSFLLILIPADYKLSFFKKGKYTENPVRYWHLLILRLQIALVYFFGGISKLNHDWLFSKQPALVILQQKAEGSFLGDLLVSDVMVNFIAYGGVVFDLSVGILLFIPKTRIPAIIAAILFNIMNAWIFSDINIFPYLMITSLVLFLEPHKVAAFLKTSTSSKRLSVETNDVQKIKKPILVLLAVYFTFQALLPFRHLLFTGNTDWTGYGQRFAWRMKIQNRKINTNEFQVFDTQKKIIYPVDFRSYGLNQDQINTLAHDPRAAIQFANFLEEHCRKNKDMFDIEIKSNIEVSFNGRPSQHMFDRSLNLLTLKNSAEIKNKIIELKKNK